MPASIVLLIGRAGLVSTRFRSDAAKISETISAKTSDITSAASVPNGLLTAIVVGTAGDSIASATEEVLTSVSINVALG